ncbi:unnamed protein product [Linum tenue]|uniref:Myb-like domain-containing protein n=1 Tax=Linum tenue TaxID=586396 RepID=A0AAV0IET3_9ROSI|nr:unnamed protein product [Linum tenue]
MLGDTATVSSSVNPGGGGGGSATNTHHHQQQHQHNLHQQQHQSHHNPNPAAIGGGGLFQEGISTSDAGGGGGGAGHVGSSSGGEEDRLGGGGGSGSFDGNRWPRQETVALLKIRTDMDATFRDASVKGPLWDEVSRKLAELGYHRSAKKCKEKFENVYKYHKRTKDVRTSKQEGKNYRFFEQLAAFESQPPAGATPPPPPPPHPQPSQPAATTMPAFNPPQVQPVAFVTMAHHITTVPSTTVPPPVVAPPITITAPSYPPAPQPTIQPLYPPSFSAFSTDLMSNSPSSSSSTSSDVELHRGGRHKRKRKWKDFFERLMTEVVHKQEEMQRKFLEAIEKREHERMAREESWRMQEMARINREREILAQERSIAAAKDAAVMSFLQKLSDQQNPGAPPLHLPNQAVQIAPPPSHQPPPPPPPPPPSVVAAAAPLQSAPNQVHSAPPPAAATPAPVQQPQLKHPVSQSQGQGQNQKQMVRADNVDQNFLPASSSRWPKVEVEALISLRRNLDSKYQENGPKGPLWEEISAGMKRLGYNRNPKRCKEKWENINKYFKKVKESNKKRPEDSKTCPYFHQLDALYREKQNLEGGGSSSAAGGGGGGGQFNSVPLMVQPEQQWPPQALPPPSVPPPPQQQQQKDTVMEEAESEDHGDDEDEDDYDDEEDDDVAGEYELVSNKPHSMNPGG